MNPNIFRKYDIRGVAGKDFSADDAQTIGWAAGTYFHSKNAKTIVVGRDCRLTSTEYAQRLITGLRKAGCDVMDIGVCPTPMLYFAGIHFSAHGGVMVTASHNPPQYNGFKLCLGADSIHGEGLLDIRSLLEKKIFTTGCGGYEKADPLPAYMDYIVGNIEGLKPFKVVVDAGNATAGPVAPALLEKLGCRVLPLYCDMNGNFPNHPADPTVAENMADLSAAVKNSAADVGFGYDGDADRIGVVDENGTIIPGDMLMLIFAREILSRKPGSVFISEVKSSQRLYDDIHARGGRAIMWKTGHSLIKKKIKEEGAALAGEMSGHMFFADRYFGFDDAFYASCRLLEIMSSTGKTLSALLADIPSAHNTPEIRVPCPDHLKFKVAQATADHFKKSHSVIDIDGVRVMMDGGWGLVRASNTEPALVLRFEADTEAGLFRIQNQVEDVLRDIQKQII